MNALLSGDIHAARVTVAAAGPSADAGTDDCVTKALDLLESEGSERDRSSEQFAVTLAADGS
jgi:hypothetical protein